MKLIVKVDNVCGEVFCQLGKSKMSMVTETFAPVSKSEILLCIEQFYISLGKNFISYE